MVRPNKMMGRIFTSGHRILYKLSKGKLAAKQGSAPVAILTTIGRKSGKEREVPIIALEDGDGWFALASYAGHDEHPAWYHNLMAQPAGTLLIGDDSHPVVATQLEGAERERGWTAMAAVYSDYDEYQKVTDRKIPVLRLAKT